MTLGAIAIGVGRAAFSTAIGRSLLGAGAILLALSIVYSRGIDAGIERCQAEALARRAAELERQLAITAEIAAADRLALAEAQETNQRNEERIDAFEAALAADACLLDEPGARLLRDLEP